MAAGDVFDLVLFGYRNDLARGRTLAFLNELSPAEAAPARLETDTSTPQRLFAALDRERAEQLRGQLEQLGAQVALLHAGAPTHEELQPTLLATRPSRRSTVRPFTLSLVLILGAVAYWWRAEHPLQLAETSLPRVTAALEALRHTAQSAGQSEAVKLNAEAIRLADAEKLDEAVATLRAALRLAPDDEVLKRNLQTVLLKWGIADLTREQFDDAQTHLEQAAELGDRAEIWRALGMTYLRQGRHADAVAALDKALQLAPRDTDAMLRLAQLYLAEDRRADALALLQQAKALGARGPDLDKFVQQLSREVDAEWGFVKLDSPHFRVSFNGDEDRHAVRQVLRTLEEAHDIVTSKFDYVPPEPTEVVLYTQEDFHDVTQTPHWAGAAYDGRIKIPVRGLDDETSDLPRILRHEFAHSIIAQLAGGRCPVWLNEGLAMWAEDDEDGERDVIEERRLANQELFTLAELRDSFINLPRQRVPVAYAESYLAVRALIDRYGARKIPDLLGALKRSGDVSSAFSEVYPGDLAGFEQRLLHQLSD
jgi:Flp pilus assembly protein TadD